MSSNNSKRPIQGWNQEVTDKEGRRRFHGAFTGGYSAGYYNSVGSKEGWTPSTFSSSRVQRAEHQTRTYEDFMDEEDDPLLGRQVVKQAKFDTLDAEAHRKNALNLKATEESMTSSVISGSLLKDLIVPTENSIGKKLLQLMGWKEGVGIGPKVRKKKISVGENKSSLRVQDVMVARRNDVSVLNFPSQKTDQFGIGFDPYVNAPEFRKYREGKMRNQGQVDDNTNILRFADAGKPGASSIANSFDHGDDDIYGGGDRKDEYDFEIVPGNKADSPKAQHRQRKSYDLCCDGNPPLDGFTIGRTEVVESSNISSIDVPKDYVPGRFKLEWIEILPLYKKYDFSTGKHGRSSALKAKDRGEMLGEVSSSTYEDAVSLAKKRATEMKQQKETLNPNKTKAVESDFKANITAAISNRFTSSSNVVEEPSTEPKKPIKPVRTVHIWKPDRLLCKRFNVAPPASSNSDAAQAQDDDSLYHKEIARHLPGGENMFTRAPKEPLSERHKSIENNVDEEIVPVETEIRPPQDLFKAIFESSDSSESE